MRPMSLVRAWRRQLYGASAAALIVPSAMLSALAVLALSGGFGSVGVLGQLFAGPSLPGIGSSGGAHGSSRGGFASASLPVVPDVAAVAPRHAVIRAAPLGHTVPVVRRGTGSAGGALGGTAGPVTSSGGGSGSGAGSGSGSASGAGSPAPTTSPEPTPPQPAPTPVDTVVQVVTSVTQQVPAPVGPVVTQTAQAVGAAVDGLLPQTGRP
jgi:hypothetical protein